MAVLLEEACCFNAVDGCEIHFAPPKKPWDDPILQHKYQQTLWFEVDFVHPQYGCGSKNGETPKWNQGLNLRSDSPYHFRWSGLVTSGGVDFHGNSVPEKKSFCKVPNFVLSPTN